MGSLSTEPICDEVQVSIVADKVDYEDIQLLSNDPMEVFKQWFGEAQRHPENNPMPEALTLSTVRKDGGPSSRTVLLRGLDDDGFKMYWDKRSKKSEEVDFDSRAALVFCWHLKDNAGTAEARQVRIEGNMEALPEDDNIEYFNGEPLLAQIRATACHQSNVVKDDRISMITEINRLWKTANKDGKKLHKPNYWGGYQLKPTMIEFYKGKRDTINDRIRFRKTNESTAVDLPEGVRLGENGWVYETLEP